MKRGLKVLLREFLRKFHKCHLDEKGIERSPHLPISCFLSPLLDEKRIERKKYFISLKDHNIILR